MRLTRSFVVPSAGPALLAFVGIAAALMAPACSGASTAGFDLSNDAGNGGGSGGAGSSGGGPSGSSSGTMSGSGSGSTMLGGNVGTDGGGMGGDATTTVTTTIYAHTNTELYSMDPASKTVTLIGSFTGMGGGSGDSSITDLAVNAAGKVYVNSETVIYTAALPPGGTGTVALTTVAPIALQSGQRFFALGFTPANALGAGTGEVLIGGDGNGELWAIDPSSGATKDLGSFGTDPNDSSATLALSGDVVFYLDSTGAPKGLATIRSCIPSSKASSSPTCSAPSDYLAGIDMTALATAYTTGAHTAPLNAGIYGSPSPNQTGPGTGYSEVFGLGAWGGNVYGFTHGSPASLLSIATSGANAGAGSIVPTSVSTSGWAGAGVTTTVTVTVSAPPPPPPPK